jgi:hypothetical protein
MPDDHLSALFVQQMSLSTIPCIRGFGGTVCQIFLLIETVTENTIMTACE